MVPASFSCFSWLVKVKSTWRIARSHLYYRIGRYNVQMIPCHYYIDDYCIMFSCMLAKNYMYSDSPKINTAVSLSPPSRHLKASSTTCVTSPLLSSLLATPRPHPLPVREREEGRWTSAGLPSMHGRQSKRTGRKSTRHYAHLTNSSTCT